MDESKHHIVLVVGLTLLPSRLSHCCFTEFTFRKRSDDQTSRNCQTRSQKSRVRDKLVQIVLQILFPCLHPSKAMSSVSVKRKCILYNRRDATYTVFFTIISPLHVSGGFSAHHQELIKQYVQPWVVMLSCCLPLVWLGGTVPHQPHQR